MILFVCVYICMNSYMNLYIVISYQYAFIPYALMISYMKQYNLPVNCNLMHGISTHNPSNADNVQSYLSSDVLWHHGFKSENNSYLKNSYWKNSYKISTCNNAKFLFFYVFFCFQLFRFAIRQVSLNGITSKANYCVGKVENHQAFGCKQPQLSSLIQNFLPQFGLRTTDEQMNATLLFEFDSFPGRRVQPNQWPRTYYSIQHE